ncbi:MAG: 50S ribosomal protein L6 [Nitrospira sp.]|nr:50S ribosomal protein L6 [Nitrospira sp.]
MSRIGNKVIEVPSGVKVEVQGATVSVSGPKGNLTFVHRPEVSVAVEGSEVNVARKNDSKPAKAFHGLTRALVSNMVEGVTKGFQKNLDIHGVGWQAKMQGNAISLQIGFCHTVDIPVPEGLAINLPNPQRIEVTGIDKQKVGEFAATIRAVRKPEPYKGKGIRYENERVVRKAGKSFVGGGK